MPMGQIILFSYDSRTPRNVLKKGICMEKILSVIVPSYNCRNFLDVGIPTFLDEAVLDKLDIIIVNDGSTDDTAAGAETYCHRYPDSIRLISQENKGHGGALNTGCAAARGKYLRVVDADDWVQTRNLAPFVEFLRCCSSDVVLTHYRTVDISTGEIRERRIPPQAFGKCLTLGDLMADRINYEQILSLHGLTYRTDFYQSHCIQLTEHVFYEDVEYATIPCCFARTISPADLFVYEYRIGDVQQSVSDVSQLKRIHHVEKVLDRMIREFHRIREQLDDGQNRYYRIKTRSLLLRYATTVLLLEPDRKKGRAMASAMMTRFREQMPVVARMARRQYLVLRVLNALHVPKAKWDAFLQSRLYKLLRNKRF